MEIFKTSPLPETQNDTLFYKEDYYNSFSDDNQNKEPYLNFDHNENKENFSSEISDLFSSNIRKLPIFEIKLLNFPGKIPSGKNLGKKQKRHGKSDNDNLLTKIQVNFMNFLVNLVNDAIKAEFDHKFLVNLFKNTFGIKPIPNHDCFRHINYDVKKKINFKYITDLFQKPIKDIIISNVSKKYKTLKNNPDFNKLLYEKLIEKSKWFEEFLDLKYIDVFINYYYYDKKHLSKIDFKGKTIIISKKTKSFKYLLKKNGNDNLTKLMLNLVRDIYLTEFDKTIPFIIINNNYN